MKRSIIGTLFLLGISVMGGCVKDETSRMATQGADVQRIVLQLADAEEIQTYSAASVNERMIEDAYVLVFDNTGMYKNGSRVDVAAGGIANNGTQTPTISVKVAPGNGDKVVVLLNTGLSVDPLASLPAGTKIEDINTLFPSSGWKFARSGADSGKGMPMSGEAVWSTTSPPVCPIYRSVAKIQVALAADLALHDVTGKFTTTADAVQWALINAPSQGNIYSVGGAMSIPALSDADFIRETGFPHRVTTMTGVAAFQMNGYLPEYDSSVKAKTADVGMSDFAPGRTCVLLKVPDAGVGGGDGYYRLDLVEGNKGDETKAYLDIRRNCHYTINISRVSSKGYDTEAEALVAPSSNVEYEITDNANHIFGNGQYAVVVDKNPVEIFSDMNTPQNLIRVGVRGNIPAGALCKVSLVKGRTSTLVSPSVMALHTADGAMIGTNKFEQVLAGDCQFMYTSRTLLPTDDDMYLRVNVGNILSYVPVRIGTLTLELSAEEVEIGSQGGQTAPVTIRTNDPGGWTATTPGPGFSNHFIQSLSSSFGASGDTLSADVLLWTNMVGEQREDYVEVTTANGALTKRLIVRQTVYPNFEIKGALEMAPIPSVFPEYAPDGHVYGEYAIRFNFEPIENIYMVVFYRNANISKLTWFQLGAWDAENKVWIKETTTSSWQAEEILLADDGFYYFSMGKAWSSWRNHFLNGNWVMVRCYMDRSEWMHDGTGNLLYESSMSGRAFQSSLVNEMYEGDYVFPYEPRL